MSNDDVMKARILKEYLQIAYRGYVPFQRVWVDNVGEGVHEEVLTWDERKS